MTSSRKTCLSTNPSQCYVTLNFAALGLKNWINSLASPVLCRVALLGVSPATWAVYDLTRNSYLVNGVKLVTLVFLRFGFWGSFKGKLWNFRTQFPTNGVRRIYSSYRNIRPLGSAGSSQVTRTSRPPGSDVTTGDGWLSGRVGLVRSIEGSLLPHPARVQTTRVKLYTV